MAAIVCHGLQSCLESQLVESRIHRLRLPSPKPKPLLTPPPPQPVDVAFKSCLSEPNTKPHCDQSGYKTETVSGWSFIQSLPNASSLKETNTYGHPQVKQSSLRLSPKSLELCTENLGNETGTDITESGIDFVSDNSLGTREQRKTPRQLLEEKKKRNEPRNFPPPLTTMRGSESLTVRPHREGGRLVIEVTKAPYSTASCFHAERSHGRLRLCLVENHPSKEEEEEEEEEEEYIQENESEVNEQTQYVDEEEEEEEEETEEEDAFGMVMEKYERANMRGGGGGGRCKEGDRENNDLLLINWGKSLWVATS